MHEELVMYDAIGQADLVHNRAARPVDLVGAALSRIEQLDPVLNAVIHLDPEGALATAEQIDPDLPFAGVPILVKDLAAEVQGMPLHEGSAYLDGYVSDHDQTYIARLRRAGFVILGKTNTPEFGMLPSAESARHGATGNPWDPSRSAGGSSGGSAAAVASGMVPVAHGNDLGGSIRIPASACGLFGLKPTRGRNPLGPRYGDVLLGWAVEHVSPAPSATARPSSTSPPGPSPETPTPRHRTSARGSRRPAARPGRCGSPWADAPTAAAPWTLPHKQPSTTPSTCSAPSDTRWSTENSRRSPPLWARPSARCTAHSSTG